MSQVVLVYDDTVEVSPKNRTIIGQRTYGDMVVRRESMFGRLKRLVKEGDEDIKIHKISQKKHFYEINYPKDTIFFHLLSNSAICLEEDFKYFLQKLSFIKSRATLSDKSGKIYGAVFSKRDEYFDFLEEYVNQGNLNFLKTDTIETNMFVDLSTYETLITYISSGFDARYFNSLQGDNFTVTKKSTDGKKITAEYQYYWLLPEHMKSFMVMPYDFKTYADGSASYTMERMPMTDIAIRWTHGAVDTEEFKKILERVFFFINTRDKKAITSASYKENADKLYLKKVDDRVKALKKLPEFSKIESLISSGTNFNSIDEIIEKYKKLYAEITKKHKNKNYYSVIGHGDVFFANMLYSKELNLLRLIDPKGATTTDGLYMDPYYDVAKLSHSICGNYDFFNVGGYDIKLDSSMQFNLSIHFDNTKYVEIFKEYLETFGFDFSLVRLYEASLFLSMLPLHMDNPYKVFGFIMNAIKILEEIETCTK